MTALNRLLWSLLLAGAAFLAVRMAAAGAVVLAVPLLAAAGLVAWVYTSRRTRASRYLLPGLAAFAVFVLMPLLYTVFIAFTNYSGEHLLSREQVRHWFAQDQSFFSASDGALHFGDGGVEEAGSEQHEADVETLGEQLGRRLHELGNALLGGDSPHVEDEERVRADAQLPAEPRGGRPRSGTPLVLPHPRLLRPEVGNDKGDHGPCSSGP